MNSVSRPCAAAENLPLVGVACGIIHDMYRAVKKAKENRKGCEQFGETLRGLEVILIKASTLNKPADSVRGLERALRTALDFLQKQTSQSYAHRVLMGDSLAAKVRRCRFTLSNPR